MGREKREGRGCQALSWDPAGAAVVMPLFGEKPGCDIQVLRRCAAAAEGTLFLKSPAVLSQVLARVSVSNIRLTDREGRLGFGTASGFAGSLRREEGSYQILSERGGYGSLLRSFIWLLLEELELCLCSSTWPRERLARFLHAE